MFRVETAFKKNSAKQRLPEDKQQQQSCHSLAYHWESQPCPSRQGPSPPSWASAEHPDSGDLQERERRGCLRAPASHLPLSSSRCSAPRSGAAARSTARSTARRAGRGSARPRRLPSPQAPCGKGGRGRWCRRFPSPLTPPPTDLSPHLTRTPLRFSSHTALTSSTARRGRCSIPRSSLSLTAEERPWKQRRMLSITEAVSSEAMLGGAHSSSVEPSLLCSHRPVSLSRIDAILGAGRKKRGFSTGIL